MEGQGGIRGRSDAEGKPRPPGLSAEERAPQRLSWPPRASLRIKEARARLREVEDSAGVPCPVRGAGSVPSAFSVSRPSASVNLLRDHVGGGECCFAWF